MKKNVEKDQQKTPKFVGEVAVGDVLVSQSDFANALGVCRTTVNKAIRTFRLEKSVVTQDGIAKIKLKEGMKEWEANRKNPLQAKKISNSSKPSENKPLNVLLMEAKTKKEQCTANLLEIELGAKRGEFVEVHRVFDLLKNLGRIAKTKMDGLPRKLSYQLSIMDDAKAIEVLMEKEIEQISDAIATASLEN